MTRLVSLVCVALLLLMSSAQAELTLAYRGIALGEDAPTVYAKAVALFPKVDDLGNTGPPITASGIQTWSNPKTTLTLISDESSKGMYFCGWDRAPIPGKNCSSRFFSFTHEDAGRTLHQIRITELFGNGIGFSAVIEKLIATYGEPTRRVTIAKTDTSHTILYWGTDNLATNFGQKGAVDFSRIKGRFVAAALNYRNDALYGYTLQIGDMDAFVRSIQASRSASKVVHDNDKAEGVKF